MGIQYNILEKDLTNHNLRILWKETTRTICPLTHYPQWIFKDSIPSPQFSTLLFPYNPLQNVSHHDRKRDPWIMAAGVDSSKESKPVRLKASPSKPISQVRERTSRKLPLFMNWCTTFRPSLGAMMLNQLNRSPQYTGRQMLPGIGMM